MVEPHYSNVRVISTIFRVSEYLGNLRYARFPMYTLTASLMDKLHIKFTSVIVVPKSETQGFDSWLTSNLRIECSFPLATSDVQMMSESKLYSYATNE